MFNSSINNNLQQVIDLYNSGGNPQQLMANILQQNPQIQQAMVQLQNMAQGRSMPEFLMQLARQNGVNDNQIQQIGKMLGGK